MKKTLLMLSFLVCFTLLAAVPAFADYANDRNNVGTYNNNGTMGNELRKDVNRGITNTNRALGTDIDQINGRNNLGARANNYRATAADDNDGIDWGWLGLLGLIGLAGMRGRDRERDRA